MKNNYLFVFFMILLCNAKGWTMEPFFNDGMNHYFKELIPKYYLGQKDFSEEMHNMPIGVYMQGNGFSEMKGTDDLLFNFYFLVNHDRQDVQVIRIKTFTHNDKVYEYWVVKLSDVGIPYRYSYFYLTEADDIKKPRIVLNMDMKYKDKIVIDNVEIEMIVSNLNSLYQATPWVRSDSYKNTRYENIKVCWKRNIPYVRKMNLFERIYYSNIKKSSKKISLPTNCDLCD